jgi:hypothetical protein
MDANTLHCFSIDLQGRLVDATLESYLAGYMGEIKAALETVGTIARNLPADSGPAPVFSFRQE